ncbi:chitobiase/beta-hexosaminidase C-terminal domain-containing protein [Jeotgalibacillus sp. ET6]|uniref:chitobiase/beta-hexosaminidase C-terminal domain-containing protein n=1 Tax=Jeotgalibacillus sp. ET6 TaxID=3037260 RepID=UPI0024183D5D|nr:chitobiase/beta-hexosaminidase C-terminal domain-containing protein [Jeotgalibacillus sp. ET6]MDG5472541.1 chitobiase/beta-hexosaminidase C-terminal domain-containing protein [Jeotgalibacillus sp. ET6]
MNRVSKQVARLVVLVMILSLLTPFASVSRAVATVTETFDALDLSGSSYVDGSFTGVNGIDWTYTGGRISNSDTSFNIDGNGIMFRDAGKGIASSPIEGGISSLTVDTKAAFTSTNARLLEVYVNDVLIGTTDNVLAGEGPSTSTFDNLDVEGPFTLEFKKVQSNSQIVLDNITWSTNDADPTKVSAVQASIPSGQVLKGESVSFTTSTPDAEIYYTLNGGEETLYTGAIEVNEDAVFEVYAKADGLDDSEMATYTYNVVEASTIREAREQDTGSTVSTQGTVTAVFAQGGANNIYMQDEEAGIVVRSAAQPEPGDVIDVLGVLEDYNGLAQISAAQENVTVLSQEEIPAAVEIPEEGLTEALEGMLVEASAVAVESFASGNYNGVDENGNPIVIRPVDPAITLDTDSTYESVTGVVGEFRGTYQLVPRTAADVVFDSNQVSLVQANPAGGFVASGDKITLTTMTEGAEIYYTTDGSDPSTSSEKYTDGVEITADTTLKAFAVKEGMTPSKIVEFNYIIQKDEIRIHDIQGADHFSDYEGLAVADVQGVVTYVVNGSSFYMQSIEPDEDPKTSEGILVYRPSHGMTVGNHVKASGTVMEYFVEGYDDRAQNDLPVTQINASGVVKEADSIDLPEPIVLGGPDGMEVPTQIIDNDNLTAFEPEEDGIDFYESIEGMLVEVAEGTVSGPQKYGEVAVITNRGDEEYSRAGGAILKEDDFNPERVTIDVDNDNLVVKTGDELATPASGVMSYGFGKYKVLVGKGTAPTFTDGGLEPAASTIVPNEEELSVAAYNIENFSANSSATSDEKVTRIAQSFITDLNSPDIIGLTEVQDSNGPTDNGTVSASESYQRLIDEIVRLGGPEYAYTEIAPEDKQDGGQPGGNIRNGFLYNPERTELTEGTAGSATEAVDYVDGELTLNPGRITPSEFVNTRKSLVAEFDFNGEEVIVIVNHFNSKGGDQPLFGQNQPPFLGSEAQRVELATMVNGFVQDIKEQTPDANVVVLGDMNDFEFSAPLEALKGEELTNLVEHVEKENRYTYNYEGNAQVLDHILVSNNLKDRSQFDIIHINSDFMEEHGRASDHDPLLAQISLANEVEPDPDEEKIINLSDYNDKRVMIFEDNVQIVADKKSKVKHLTIRGTNVTFSGKGFKEMNVTLHPRLPGSEYDFSGDKIKKVEIRHKNASVVKGAENIQKLEVKGGAKKADVQYFDSEGNEINPFIKKPGKPKRPKAA